MAEVFQNKIIVDKVNVVFKQYPNIPKHCPPADVIQAILMGDSRKYPYHTTDGFKDFRRGGGIVWFQKISIPPPTEGHGIS